LDGVGDFGGGFELDIVAAVYEELLSIGGQERERGLEAEAFGFEFGGGWGFCWGFE